MAGRLLVAVALALSIPGAGVAGAVGTAVLATTPTPILLAKAVTTLTPTHARHRSDWVRYPLIQDVHDRITAGQTAPVITAALAQRLAIPTATAERLLRAILLHFLVMHRPAPDSYHPDIAEGALAALAAAPHAEDLYTTCSWALSNLPEAERGKVHDRVLAIVAATDDPVDTALAMAPHVPAPLVRFAAARRANDPEILIALMTRSQPAERVARARQGLGVAQRPEHRLYFAAALIEGLLNYGLLAEAVVALAELPEAEREAILAGRQVALAVAGILPQQRARAHDLRFSLAAALAALGRLDDAAELLSHLPAIPDEPPHHQDPHAAPPAAAELEARREAAPRRLAVEVTRALLAPSPEAFDVLARASPWLDWSSIVGSGYAPIAAAALVLAHRAGYPHLSAWLLDGLAASSSSMAFLPPGAAGEDEATSAAAARLREVARVRMDVRRAEAAALRQEAWARWGRDPLGATVARLLDGDPRGVPLPRPLPEVLRRDRGPATRFDGAREMVRKQLNAAHQFPREFYPARVEETAHGKVALGTSSTYGSGWWLARTTPGGEWEYLFTGLPSLRYEVPGDSLVPLGSPPYQVEVRIREIWAGGDFVKTGEQIDHLVIELDPEALRADRDEDGLPDLVEGFLALDPDNPDTDGDGLDDRCDPLPHVRPAGRPTPAMEVVAVALGELLADPAQAGLPPRPRRGKRQPIPGPLCGTGPLLESEHTSFVVAPRNLLGAFAPRHRVVALDPDEGEAERRRHRNSARLVLTLIEVDHTGSDALIMWRQANTWGILRVRRTEHGWRTEQLMYAMS